MGAALVGCTLGGRYRLIRVLGRGGMGVVYEAANSMGKRFALKVLDASLAQRAPASVERFFQEARSSAALASPHVVSVIDALAVPMFVVIGAELARGRVRDLPAIVLVATVSGVGGGLLRDMLAGDTPELLRPGQFNTLLAVLAAALYLLLAYTLGYNRLWSAWIVIGLYFVTRLLIIRFNWRTRPLSEFEIRHVVEGVTGRLPGWKKGGEMRDSKPQ